MTIDYGKLEADAEWDGLKGYLTNTNIPLEEVTPPTTTYGTLKELSVSQNQR